MNTPDKRQRPDRRTVLVGAAASAAGLSALALWKRGLQLPAGAEAHLPRLRPPRAAGASSHLIPNVRVQTHRGDEAWFYDELVHDRIVAIHFFSRRGDRVYPVLDNLVRVQDRLGRRVGRDVFFISVTTDPEEDTPEALAELAREKGMGPGWTLVTGGARELDFLRGLLFVRRSGVTAPARIGVEGPCCSGGLVRYGNERLGRWGSFPAKISPAFIATRFQWIGFRPGDAPRQA